MHFTKQLKTGKRHPKIEVGPGQRDKGKGKGDGA